MIVGLTLVGCVTGVGAAVAALVLGQGGWMALLTYSGTGVLAVLSGAMLVALRRDQTLRDEALQASTRSGPLPRAHRG